MMEWQDYLHAHAEDHVGALLDLLRIPSISALSEHAGDVRRAANWTAERLRAAGIEDVQLLETGGHPLVYGAWLHTPGRPTVLIYGHFDVQPVDPLNLWTHPPFEPFVAEGRVYARGASDMKGSLVAAIAAVEALLQSKARCRSTSSSSSRARRRSAARSSRPSWPLTVTCWPATSRSAQTATSGARPRATCLSACAAW